MQWLLKQLFQYVNFAGSPFMLDVEGQIVKETAILAKSEVQKMNLKTRNFRINQQQWILLQAFGSSVEDFSHFQISIIGFPFICVIYRMKNFGIWTLLYMQYIYTFFQCMN